MYIDVILFIEFLKTHKNILQNLNSEELNLETIYNKIIPLAKENGFNLDAKDIFNYINERIYKKDELIDDTILENVGGGKAINKFIACGLLSLIGITKLTNDTSYAMDFGKPSSSNSVAVTETQKTVKTIKSMSNNMLSQDEIEYYQGKIGPNYKIISPKGMSGSYATAYNLEDNQGNRFVLKICNNPQNTEHQIQQQRKTQEKINKYYSDYNGNLKIPNYVKIGNDFVIEENLGEKLDLEILENLDDKEQEKFVNGIAEFLAYTHKNERDKVFPYILGHEGVFTLKDAYNYLNDAGALNSDEQKSLTNLISYFEKRDTSDEITALTHTDIRLQNIVYNSKTKTFGLIDFESLNTIAPIYYDFTSGTVGSYGIPYDLCSKIIDRYNEISDIKVDKEKIKTFHKLGTMYEFCTCAKFRDNRNKEEICTQIWNNGIKQRFEKIDKGFSSLE